MRRHEGPDRLEGGRREYRHADCVVSESERARRFWNSVKSTPCYREASGEHKAWADLLAVVAARNAPEIISQGKRLLERPSSLPRNELTYLTSAMAAAYIRAGQIENASSLLAEEWDRLDLAGEFSLSLLLDAGALVGAGHSTSRANGSSSSGGR